MSEITSSQSMESSDTIDSFMQKFPEAPGEVGESEVLTPAGLHGAEDPRAFRLSRPDEFLEPMSRPERVEPFRDPREFTHRINPDFEYGEAYKVNCADSARCFESSWRGYQQEAAGRAYEIPPEGGLEPLGESSAMTEEWAQEKFAPANATDLRSALELGGHGTSGIIHSQWEGRDPGGHGYNVVNHNGEILTVDPQENKIFDYSENIYPGMERLPDVRHRAMVWDASGKRVY